MKKLLKVRKKPLAIAVTVALIQLVSHAAHAESTHQWGGYWGDDGVSRVTPSPEMTRAEKKSVNQADIAKIAGAVDVAVADPAALNSDFIHNAFINVGATMENDVFKITAY